MREKSGVRARELEEDSECATGILGLDVGVKINCFLSYLKLLITVAAQILN
jgi:hypothetical protein